MLGYWKKKHNKRLNDTRLWVGSYSFYTALSMISSLVTIKKIKIIDNINNLNKKAI